jgi:antitoxin MazE
MSNRQVFVSAEQTVQAWGNGLAVRITSPVAKVANFRLGQPVVVEVVEEGVLLRRVGEPRLSLSQMLKKFDPAVHGGEAMAFEPVGVEAGASNAGEAT